MQLLFGFYDPCHLPKNPGWPLRNFLAFISLRWKLEKINFLCYREKHGLADMGSSLVGEALVSIPQGSSPYWEVPLPTCTQPLLPLLFTTVYVLMCMLVCCVGVVDRCVHVWVAFNGYCSITFNNFFFLTVQSNDFHDFVCVDHNFNRVDRSRVHPKSCRMGTEHWR